MKTKILIVDDELSSISNIKLLLSDSINYELAGDFSDPSQALLWLAEHDVDIILSDMNMPKMNGVEFIRMIHNIRPDIHIIAISGYDDFDYVRGCMRLGVHDYLLKHRLTKDILINTLDNVRQKLMPNITADKSTLNKNDMMKTIFDSKSFDPDKVQLLIDQNKLSIDTSHMVMILINSDYNNAQAHNFENYASNASVIILDITRHVISNRHKYMTYITGDSNVIILISFSDIASYQYILSMSHSIISRIKNTCRRLLNITLSIGISNISHDLKEIANQYHQLLQQIQHKLYLGPDRIYRITNTPVAKLQPYFLPSKSISHLEYVLTSTNMGDLKKELNQIFEKLKEIQCDRESLNTLCMQLSTMVQNICPNINPDIREEDIQYFEFIEQYQHYIFSMFLNAADQLKMKASTLYSPQIAQAIEYINTNYAQDISLESCANHVGVSYTHMSRIFSRETGTRFSEYLNSIRIKKAKALILQNQLKMKEIVSLSGFNNYNYFFKVFKEITGVTPNDFLFQSKKL